MDSNCAEAYNSVQLLRHGKENMNRVVETFSCMNFLLEYFG